MNILLTNITFLPTVGGVENSLYFLAKELLNKGHNVKILTLDNKENNLVKEEYEGISVFRYTYTKSKIPFVLHFNIKKAYERALEIFFSNEKVDEIWVRNGILANVLGARKMLCKIKYILPTTPQLNIKGLYGSLNGIKIRILEKVDYYSWRKIEKVNLNSESIIPIVFSNVMLRQLQKEFGNNAALNLIYPGVDINFFKPTYECNNNEINLLQKNKYILFVGRIAAAKNIEILLDVIKKIPTSIRLVIVGEGAYTDNIKKYAQELGILNRVIFLGKQQGHLPFIYTHALLTFLPTKIESFGQVLVESLACGTPVAGFGNNPAIFDTAVSEIVTKPYNGLVLEQFSPEYVWETLEPFIQRVEIDSNLRRKNREYVINEFSWSRTVDEIVKL